MIRTAKVMSEPPRSELHYCMSDQAIAPSPFQGVSRKQTSNKLLVNNKPAGEFASESRSTRRSNPLIASMTVSDLLVMNTSRSHGRSRLVRETMPTSKNSLGCSLTLSNLKLNGNSQSSVDQFGVSDLTMDSGLISSYQRSSRAMLLDEKYPSRNELAGSSHGTRGYNWKPTLALPLAQKAFPNLTSDCRDTSPPRKPGRKDSASTQSLAETVSSVFKRISKSDRIPKFPSRASSASNSHPALP